MNSKNSHKYVEFDENDIEFDEKAIKIGDLANVNYGDYPNPYSFYKAVCHEIEGLEFFREEMLYMTDLINTYI